ncbi:MAG TPA: DDE-type integrase/transposase/recombinase [Gemmataceae bacterium]|jgi:transposase-like protein/IS1 family transposase
MLCPICDRQGRRYGKDRKGIQRYFCRECYITFTDPRPPRAFGNHYLTMEKAASAIKHLVEGSSIRSTCRLARIGSETLLQLLLKAGQGCEQLMDERVVAVPVSTIQCDEIWSFVYCKEKLRLKKYDRYEDVGDCYTWTAIDPRSKLLLAYAVGKRDQSTAWRFLRKLYRAATGPYQINTDGLGIYKTTIPLVFGGNQDHAQIIKIFGRPTDGEARYSPPEIINLHVQAANGDPDLRIASTSHVERSNLTVRMMLRRFTRLTNGHSKSWKYHEAAIALLFAYYNFVRPHMTLTEKMEYRCTPAMQAGLTDHVWTVEELIRQAIPEGEEARVS